MTRKTSKVFAETVGGGRVRVTIPSELCENGINGRRQTRPGVFLVGLHRGYRWGVVAEYSTWTKPNGMATGFEYKAYSLKDKGESEIFDEMVASLTEDDVYIVAKGKDN